MARFNPLLDVNNPGAKVIRSPMGGGWIIPLTDTGREVLEGYFGERAAPIAPLGGVKAWIVEPHDSSDLAEYLLNESITWTVD